MKLTVGRGAYAGGFALPAILIVSTVMIAILVASIAAAASSRVSLDSQYYNLLAKQAAQSGVARANECLSSNGYVPQWSTVAASRDLRPNSDCTGATMVGSGVSAYVVGDGVGPSLNVRTRYSIEAPDGSGVGSILKVIGTTELVRTSSPFNVWRSFQQELYHRIEAPQAVACPEGFIPVPGDSRFNTNDFCIGKYEAKNVGGKAVSQAGGAPYADISQTQAITAAANSCAGCRLVSEAQWLTVAHNVAGVASNWSNNSVGNGAMYRGHTDNNPSGAQAAGIDDTNGYFNTSNSSGEQRRTLMLNNGEIIWDFSGNISEYTSGTVSGSGNQPGGSGYTWRQWNAIGGTGTVNPNPFPVFGTPAASGWTSAHGIGQINSSNSESGLRAFIRGGNSGDNSNAGIFSLGLDNSPSSTAGYIGFRIAFEPLSEISCTSGFIPVPGNSLFGTNNFCVSKYEAKNNGSGTVVSQPGTAPWVSITQTNAITTAANACTACRLIGEAEWLTIAHDIVNVPSNWSGGSVGSGYVYRGHSDGSPASNLTASSDDTNGYVGTGNVSGDQKRTLTLSNGQVIWDFAGNAWEWTSGQITGGQPGASSYAWREWNAVTGIGTLSPNPFPVFATSAASGWTGAANGIGQFYSSTADATLRATRRGGSRALGNSTGIFTLSYGSDPSASGSDIGFRVVEIK